MNCWKCRTWPITKYIVGSNETAWLLRLTFLLVLTGAAGCSDDDESLGSPVITILSPEAQSKVSGVVNIKATASDNDGISKMQLFLDNISSPLRESSAASIEFSLNTQLIDDGEHTLRVVATDAKANTGEQLLTFVVRNALFTFAMPQGYAGTSDSYIIISDSKGKVMDYDLLSNGEKYAFIAPQGFSEQYVTMTLCRFDNNPKNSCTLDTYANLPPGDYGYVVKPNPYGPRVSKGTGTVRLSDADGSDYLSIVAAKPYSMEYSKWSFDEALGLKYEFTFFEDKSAVLFSLYENDQWKYLYREMSVGQNLTYALSDFVTPTTKPMTVPGNGWVNLTMVGTNSYGDFAYVPTKLVERTNGNIKVPVPAVNFSSLLMQVSANDGDVTNMYVLRGSPTSVPTAIKTISGSLGHTRSGNTIMLSSTAVADVAWFMAENHSAFSDSDMLWRVYADPKAPSVVVPEIPEALIGAYSIPESFDDLADKYGFIVYVDEFKEYNGFADYVEKTFDVASTLPDYTELTTKMTVAEQGSSGRHATTDKHSLAKSYRPN